MIIHFELTLYKLCNAMIYWLHVDQNAFLFLLGHYASSLLDTLQLFPMSPPPPISLKNGNLSLSVPPPQITRAIYSLSIGSKKKLLWKPNLFKLIISENKLTCLYLPFKTTTIPFLSLLGWSNPQFSWARSSRLERLLLIICFKSCLQITFIFMQTQ